MPVALNSRLNPNPVVKLVATFLLGLTVVHPIHPISEWAIVFILSFLFYRNGWKRDAARSLVLFGLLFLLPNLNMIGRYPVLLKMVISLLAVVRMFILPFLAGNLMIKTSDVGSIVTSMDKLKLPKNLSIPIAVMFRFFPSFREERKHIKTAMKIRGISRKNPLAYVEYVAVPLLIVSSTISEDISKAAETKAIENPAAKTRYTPVTFRPVDLAFLLILFGFVIGGWLW
ncbi:MAG: energy-coupling factor transporter transmembrane component T [Peptoniphilus sp.]|nr:energy-coupling factor transporter transmembrane component T [Peptoniphilus sp.]MDD7363081.1 energy-coupling factor transporter transmembrane component T [Bacillota bacterium]MDY6044409.1 energy-coupling factor transporter transmembrane component T [Peptoniphilus sp.]